MAEHPDLSTWQSVGLAIAGIIAGAGSVFGIKRRARTSAGDKVRQEIRTLQDTVLTMGKDIESMKDAHRTHVITMERMNQEHDVVVAEMFRELKSISLSLREVVTKVDYVLGKRDN